MRSLTKATTHRGHPRCTSTCSGAIYVNGANDTAPVPTHRDFPAWEQSASRVLYYFTSYVSEQILSYIRDARTSKDAWGNLKKIFATSTTTTKLQLRQELSNLRQGDLSVADYTSKIKDICDSLTSIDVNVKEGEMVQICLGRLALKFGVIRTDVCTRENMPSFFDLQSMLLVEENHVGASTSTHTDIKMLYTDEDRPRARGGRGELARDGGGRREQGRRHSGHADSNSGPFESRGNIFGS